MRSQIVISQLPRNIAASGLATSAEIKKFIALLDQTRSFNVVMVPAIVPATPPEFSADELLAWYESHTEDYQSEEQVIIEYIELDAAFLPVGLPPEEDFLREQFEAQKGRFISPEQRHVAHILIEAATDADEAVKETARQTAQDLSKRALAGEDFAVLAKENSEDQGSSAEGGDLGWVEPGVMVKAFENAMYELSMAAPISEPVQTGFGWHVIKLLEIRESSGMGFDEARMVLVGEYEAEEADRAFLEQADRLVDLIYEDPTTLESAALVMDLPLNQAGPFTRAGGEGVSANSEFVEAAFSDLVLLQGSVSDPINLDENRLVMIKLSEHFPVVLKPLGEVRDEIITTLNNKLARDNAEARATELLASLQAGDSGLEALATEAELDFSHHEALKRSSFVPDRLLVQEIFKLQKPVEDEALQTVLQTGNGYAVIELESVVDGELVQGSPLAKRQYERVLANSTASQEAFAMMRQLRANAEITIFEERIQ